MSSCIARRSFFVLTAIFLLSFTGCGEKLAVSGNSAFTSDKGVKVETLLPEQVSILLSLGTKEVEQQNKFAKLIQAFPQDSFKNTLTTQIAHLEDILPLIGEHPRAMVAFTGGVDTPTPDVIAIVAITDETATDTALEKLTQEGYIKNSTNGAIIYSKEDFSLVRYQDLVILATKKTLIEEALKRSQEKTASLLQNQNYQKGIAKVNGSFGFLFSDTQYFLDSIPKVTTELQQVSSSKLMAALEGEIYGFYAEDQGLRIKGSTYADEKKLQETKASFNELNLHEAYLYKQIPGDGMAYYLELYNPRNTFETAFERYENTPNSKQTFAQIRSFFTLQGIDVEKDLLTFLDRGMAFSIRKVGGIIPEIGLYIDASSNPTGAKKVMEKMQSTLETLFQQVSTAPEAAPLLKLLTHEKTPDANYKWSIDLNKLSAEDKQKLPPLFINTIPSLTFGTTPKDVAFIKLGIEGDTTIKTFADNEDLKQAQSFIDGFDKGFFYINPQAFMSYFDDLVAFAQSFGTGNSTAQTQEYEHFKQYILPVKSIIFSSAQPSTAEAAIESFIYIEQPTAPSAL